MVNLGDEIIPMMRNVFFGAYKPLTAADIAAFEHQTGMSLPPDMAERYMNQNGGVPEKPCWRYKDWDPFCLARILPIRTMDATEIDFPQRCAMQDVVEDVQPGIHLPAGYLPFGEDWGGNYFCWDTAGSGIYFVPMDVGDEVDKRKIRLADTFATFLEGLQEETEQ